MDYYNDKYVSLKSIISNNLEDIKQIIIKNNECIEEKFFYYKNTFNRYNDLIFKQINLFYIGSLLDNKVCQIGFNGGLALLILLYGWDDRHPIDITIFDEGRHRYNKSCFEYINRLFPYINFQYIEGDYNIEIPRWITQNSRLKYTYNVVHINSEDTEFTFNNNIDSAIELVKIKGFIVIEGASKPYINKIINEYISTKQFIEVFLLKPIGYPHRIIRKIKN